MDVCPCGERRDSDIKSLHNEFMINILKGGIKSEPAHNSGSVRQNQVFIFLMLQLIIVSWRNQRAVK